MNEELVRVETLKAEVAPVVQRAEAMVISTPQDYEMAAEFCKTVKGAAMRVVEFFAPMVKANLEATRRTNDAKAQLLNPLVAAEASIKNKQTAYSREQERIRLAEQQRLQAIEDERVRKEKAKADASARLQREKEAAARAKQERLERLAAQARNEVERHKAAAAAEAARKVAEAAAAKAAVKEDAADAVGPAAVVTVASKTPVIKGQHFTRTWKARVVDVKAVPREWLVVNEQALQAFARSTKGAVQVAGVEFYEETSLASASR